MIKHNMGYSISASVIFTVGASSAAEIKYCQTRKQNYRENYRFHVASLNQEIQSRQGL